MTNNSSINSFVFFQNLSIVRTHIKGYLIVTITCMLLGYIIVQSIPKTYTTKVMLAPESSNEMDIAGKMGSLASLAGINIGGSADAIFPEIYPDVIRSTSFLINISKTKVTTIDNSFSGSLYNYFCNETKNPWWLTPLIKFSQKAKQNGDDINPYQLTKDQYSIIKAIGNSIICDITKDNGIIVIKTSAQDPMVATMMAEAVSKRLQNFITDYRTNKARNDLTNISKMQQEAEIQYRNAIKAYSSFVESHKNISEESFIARKNELDNEMQMRNNIYTQASIQLNVAKAKLIEKTPIYAVLQPASVPITHSSPKKFLMILAFTVLGLIGYTFYIMLKR